MTTNIFALIVVLGVLVFIHEFGHFLFARLFGVGVEKFSLGFGPRIIGKKYGITDYRISAIPLGGYVKMVGEEPDAEIDPDEIPLSFTHKHVFKRIAIVAAGPCFNFVLAVGIFFLMFQIFGIQLIKPVVRAVSENSPAQRAGIEKNDRVVAVNGIAIESWEDIDKIITSGKGEKLAVSVQRGGLNFVKDVLPELTTGKNIFGEDVDYYDIGASGLPVLKPVVGGVLNGAPAEKGGLKQGDLIQAINGTRIQTWNQMKEIIDSSKGQNLEISVLRNSSTLVFNIIPEHKTEQNSLGEKVDSYRIGISTPGLASSGAVFTKKLNPLTALWESLVKTYELSKLIVVGIGKMFQGAISPKELGGPIIIAKMAGDQARQGAISFIFFIAFLSINLAILNFLPIPVLDGGHLLFFGIEAVIRRPVNTRVREVAMQIGLFILLSLMVFVFYNDTMRFKDVIIDFFNNILQFFKGMAPG